MFVTKYPKKVYLKKKFIIFPKFSHFKMSTRVRNWVFTWNNYTSDAENLFSGAIQGPSGLSYVLGGYEVGESGTPHIQGYAEFKKAVRLSALQRHFGKSIHWEPRKGTAAQAKAYCKKEVKSDDDWFEYGEPKKQGERTDIREFLNLCTGAKHMWEVIEADPDNWFKFHRAARVARTEYQSYQAIKKGFRKDLKVTVLWGDSGTGKTRLAMAGADPFDTYTLPLGSEEKLWFDGYEGQSIIVIDDYYGWIRWGAFLRLTDGHRLRVPIKTTMGDAAWTQVYVTSNKHPRNWYPNKGYPYELWRRITEIWEFRRGAKPVKDPHDDYDSMPCEAAAESCAAKPHHQQINWDTESQ